MGYSQSRMRDFINIILDQNRLTDYILTIQDNKQDIFKELKDCRTRYQPESCKEASPRVGVGSGEFDLSMLSLYIKLFYDNSI